MGIGVQKEVQNRSCQPPINRDRKPKGKDDPALPNLAFGEPERNPNNISQLTTSV